MIKTSEILKNANIASVDISAAGIKQQKDISTTKAFIYYTKLPEEYLKFILKWEGGYVNDPDDPGGETNRGITIGALNKAKSQGIVPNTLTIKDLTKDLETVRKIYERNYYLAGKCDKIPHPLALCYFDSCINNGLGGAGKLLQRTILSNNISIKIDGSVGPKTLECLDLLLKVRCVENVAADFNNFRRHHFEDIAQNRPTSKKFLKGWLNRLDALIAYIK